MPHSVSTLRLIGNQQALVWLLEMVKKRVLSFCWGSQIKKECQIGTTHLFSHNAHLLYQCNLVCRCKTLSWEEVCCVLCNLHCWHMGIWPGRGLCISPAGRIVCWGSPCLLYIQPWVIQLYKNSKKKKGLIQGLQRWKLGISSLLLLQTEPYGFPV